MHWLIIICITAGTTVFGAEFTDNALTIRPPKTVRLDPILRRALLRALTELEEEAQAKAQEEEQQKLSQKQQQQQQLDQQQQTEAPQTESPEDEIQSTADTTYPTMSPIIAQDTLPPEDPTTQPPATVQDAFFFHTPEPLELSGKLQKAEVNQLDIETNLISDEKVTKTTPKPVEVPTIPPIKNLNTGNSEVEIFQAPLAAAFTLHQDSRGTPHSIIPIFRNQEPPQQNQQVQIPKKEEPLFFPPSPSHALQFQQQYQFPPLHTGFRPLINSITVTPHSQPHQHHLGFPSSTAFPPISSNSIVPAQNFHVSSTPNPIQDLGFSTPRSFPSSTGQPEFTIPPVTLPLQNEQRFQVSQFQRQLEEQRYQQHLQALNRQRELEEERLRALAGVGPDRFRAQRGFSFQPSLAYTFNQHQQHQQGFFQQQQQPQHHAVISNNRVNRQEAFGSTGNFGFNHHRNHQQEYRTIPDEVYRQTQHSAQQQLKELLYRSGLTSDPTDQEELNIVSKVLALNHERSDVAIDDAAAARTGQSKRPATVGKSLLVGEIEDLTGAR